MAKELDYESDLREAQLRDLPKVVEKATASLASSPFNRAQRAQLIADKAVCRVDNLTVIHLAKSSV